MKRTLTIGTRESQLAVWQAELVQQLLLQHGYESELVYIKSDGDIDLITPLYALGVQGVFTKTLDAALLSNRIDIAVHSMKDVPTQLAQGIVQSAVLPRASHKDIFVYNNPEVLQDWLLNDATHTQPITTIEGIIGTSSIRRKAQWLNRYPHHQIENLRGNVNTRLQKVAQSHWHGAIFAAAGLERIGLRPSHSVELPWMLPAPAQGAIMIACLATNTFAQEATSLLNHTETALCTKIERDFLHTLMGGCSTPISALAEINEQTVTFKGNIFTLNGSKVVETSLTCDVHQANDLGSKAANNLLLKGAKEIVESIRYAQ